MTILADMSPAQKAELKAAIDPLGVAAGDFTPNSPANTRVAALEAGVGRRNVRLVFLGDSLVAHAEQITGLNIIRTTRGFATSVRILTGQRFYSPPEYNFGLAGDTLAQIAARTPLVVALAPQVCVVEGGTNSLGGATLAELKSTAMNDIIVPILKVCETVILIPIPPRGPAAALGASQQADRQAYNAWLQDISRGRGDLSQFLPANKAPVFVDVNEFLETHSNTTGYPIQLAMYDDIHTANLGSYLMGRAVADVLNAMYPVKRRSIPVADSFNATTNPGGNLLPGIAAQFGDTFGAFDTLAGVTPTGTIATGWRAWRTFGTSTATMVLSKESPRTDVGFSSGEQGDRQIVAISSGVGGNIETYEVRYPGTTGNVAAGDKLTARMSFQHMIEPVGLQGVHLELRVLDSSNNVLAKAVDGQPFTDVPRFLTGSPLAHKGILETPTITAPTNATKIEVALVITTRASQTNSAVTVALSDASARKVS